MIDREIALQWQRANQPDWAWFTALSADDREIIASAGDEVFAVRHGELMAARISQPMTPAESAELTKAITAELEKPAPTAMIEPPEFQGELTEEQESRLANMLNDAVNIFDARRAKSG